VFDNTVSGRKRYSDIQVTAVLRVHDVNQCCNNYYYIQNISVINILIKSKHRNDELKQKLLFCPTDGSRKLYRQISLQRSSEFSQFSAFIADQDVEYSTVARRVRSFNFRPL